MSWERIMHAVRLTVIIAIAALSVGSDPAVIWAHENHAPLPTKGVTIAGETILLSDKAREAIGLTTAKIELRDLHRILTVNARVELPWHAQAMITSLVPGKIDRVLVRPGEAVTVGQPLARVVSSELETLQMEMLQAQTQFEFAQKLVEQQRELTERGIIAGKTLLESQTALAEASAMLQIARQKLIALGLDRTSVEKIERSGELVAYVPILSPISGVVTHADVRIGQMVRATDHLYHVVDPAILWIVGEVLESDIRLLAKGQAVEARFAALPDDVFRGQIDRMALTMSLDTRTQEVVIAVDNAKGTLRPGMFGRVRISVEVAKQAIVCPQDAIIRSRTGNYVLVQRVPGKYENRAVKLGLSEEGLVEVLDGVFPGDHVVVVGNSLLASLLGNEHKARVGQQDAFPAVPENRDVVAVVHGTVELPTDQQALAMPQIEGRIRRVLVQPGERVARGDVLVELDSLQLRSLQLDLLQTVAQARLAEESLARLAQLHDQQVVAQRQRWKLESERMALRAKAATLERQLAHLGLTAEALQELKTADLSLAGSLDTLVKSLPLRAPLDGHLAGFHVVPGQVVRPDEPLFEIHDLSRVWIKGFVYERDANRVHLGQRASVRFTAYPELEIHGRVVRISPLMHQRMRVLPVWVEVANPDQLLKSGMLAQLTIWDESPLATSADDSVRPESLNGAQ